MATIIQTNGKVRYVEPANGRDFSILELKQIVGGWIEVIQYPPSLLIVCNEEGKLLGLHNNHTATRIYGHLLAPNDFFVGNILICKKSEIL